MKNIKKTSSFQDGTTTSQDMPLFGIMTFPVYRKEDNNNLFLAHPHNITGTAFIFWGGPHFGPGTHIGNIQLGHIFTSCPENASPHVRGV